MFRNVNNPTGPLPTSISNTCIYSPTIKSGTIYSSRIYAGEGEGFTEMTSNGLYVTDANGTLKMNFGCNSGPNDWTYPFFILGAGESTEANGKAGCIMKFGAGIWIGTSDVSQAPGDDPNVNLLEPSSYSDGIFINFDSHNIKKCIAGSWSDIGTAVFG